MGVAQTICTTLGGCRRAGAGKTVALALSASLLTLGCAAGEAGSERRSGQTRPVFSQPSEITNPYLPLAGTRRVELRGRNDGAEVRAVKTLLERTEVFEVDGQRVDAAVIEDRSFEDGELHEIAVDFYAQADDGTVYYLGEDVNYYERGKVVGHEGAFRYGRETEVLGVAMPADPRPGAEFSIEDVPGVGSERNRVTATGDRATVDGSTYDDVVTIEGRVLPDREDEIKYYARGVGLLRETGPKSDVRRVGGPGSR